MATTQRCADVTRAYRLEKHTLELLQCVVVVEEELLEAWRDYFMHHTGS